MAFGSGYFQWACTLDTIARLISLSKKKKKKKVKTTTMMDATAAGAATEEDGGKEEAELAALRRQLARRKTFVKHVWIPIMQLHRAAAPDMMPSKIGKKAKKKNTSSSSSSSNSASSEEGDDGGGGGDSGAMHARLDFVNRRLELVGGRIKASEWASLPPKKRLKAVMLRFLPAADALLQMTCAHIPAPHIAQRHRAPRVYDGLSVRLSLSLSLSGLSLLACVCVCVCLFSVYPLRWA